MRRMYRKNRMEENFTQQLEPGYSRRPRKYAYSRGDCRSSRRRINRGGQIHRYGDTIDMRGFRTHHFGHYPRGQKAFQVTSDCAYLSGETAIGTSHLSPATKVEASESRISWSC